MAAWPDREASLPSILLSIHPSSLPSFSSSLPSLLSSLSPSFLSFLPSLFPFLLLFPPFLPSFHSSFLPSFLHPSFLLSLLPSLLPALPSSFPLSTQTAVPGDRQLLTATRKSLLPALPGSCAGCRSSSNSGLAVTTPLCDECVMKDPPTEPGAPSAQTATEMPLSQGPLPAPWRLSWATLPTFY